MVAYTSSSRLLLEHSLIVWYTHGMQGWTCCELSMNPQRRRCRTAWIGRRDWWQCSTWGAEHSTFPSLRSQEACLRYAGGEPVGGERSLKCTHGVDSLVWCPRYGRYTKGELLSPVPFIFVFIVITPTHTKHYLVQFSRRNWIPHAWYKTWQSQDPPLVGTYQSQYPDVLTQANSFTLLYPLWVTRFRNHFYSLGLFSAAQPISYCVSPVVNQAGLGPFEGVCREPLKWAPLLGSRQLWC